LAAATLMALACLLPLATFYGAGEELALRVFGAAGAPAVDLGYASVLLAVLMALTAGLLLVDIFMYKNRWMQLRFCFAATVLLLGSQGFVIFYIMRCATWADTWKFGPAAVFPLAALVLTILAIRSIVRDDRLVKSLDRLR
jgi:hypothetical protein